ncbi:MAG: hypothetical protein IJR49_06295 [Treponema sp.]|nr:hypothetical protein [Treponema sp.]
MTLDEVRKNAYKNAQGKSNSKVANINEKKVELDKAVNAIKEGGLLKVPRPDNNVYRRVAKFLLIIGKDEAAKVLQHISQEQTEKIVAELATIQGVDSSERDQIMNEFHDLLQQSRESGGLEVAREILNKAYGKEKADELIKSSVQFPEGKPFVYLNDKSSEKISALLKDESAAVKALVLSHIESQKAADVISKMDATERT